MIGDVLKADGTIVEGVPAVLGHPQEEWPEDCEVWDLEVYTQDQQLFCRRRHGEVEIEHGPAWSTDERAVDALFLCLAQIGNGQVEQMTPLSGSKHFTGVYITLPYRTD